MTHDSKLLIKPHLNTSNIYVRHAIVRDNIANCNKFISSTPRQNVSSALYWSIVQARKKQEAILKEINKQIKNIEQMGFAFGSNFLDQ